MWSVSSSLSTGSGAQPDDELRDLEAKNEEEKIVETSGLWRWQLKSWASEFHRN